MTKLSTREKCLDNLIKQVRQVATEIRFLPPVKGLPNMLRILAATLDYRGIRPLKTENSHPRWLTATYSREILTDRLFNFLKKHLSDLLSPDSPVFANWVSKVELAKGAVSKDPSEPTKGTNIGGWTIRQDKHGYFRAYRKIEGKTRSVYLGRSLEGAEAKLSSEREITKTNPKIPERAAAP